MSMKNIIAVLEDQQTRLDWLRSAFPSAEIIADDNVVAFLKQLAAADKDRLAVIILDHDLGAGGSWPKDAESNDGLTAARNLGTWSDVPVLVWSWNPDGANAMVAALENSGFSVIKKIAFGSTMIRQFITSVFVYE